MKNCPETDVHGRLSVPTETESTRIYQSQCTQAALAQLLLDEDADPGILLAAADAQDSPFEPFTPIAVAYFRAFVRGTSEGCVRLPRGRVLPMSYAAYLERETDG